MSNAIEDEKLKAATDEGVCMGWRQAADWLLHNAEEAFADSHDELAFTLRCYSKEARAKGTPKQE